MDSINIAVTFAVSCRISQKFHLSPPHPASFLFRIYSGIPFIDKFNFFFSGVFLPRKLKKVTGMFDV